MTLSEVVFLTPCSSLGGATTVVPTAIGIHSLFIKTSGLPEIIVKTSTTSWVCGDISQLGKIRAKLLLIPSCSFSFNIGNNKTPLKEGWGIASFNLKLTKFIIVPPLMLFLMLF
jgi:hypothetical protein